ncbi:hypothetical protein DRQ09_05925 [candidate division KSB1 bacterium]|nr:MAG: hypothetical protein DRQ09_05925 [candidate division KSB1 bacterium]
MIYQKVTDKLIKGIVLGKYIQKDSTIHKIDPRTKLFILIPILSAITASNNILFISGYFLIFLIGFSISKIPFKYLFINIRPFLWILIITFFIHLFFSSGKIIFTLYFIRITEEGIVKGGLNTFRIFLLLSFSILLMLTTSPLDLTDSFEKILNPLKKINIPVDRITIMMGISLRFIPTLFDEAERIKKAQMARGASFEGNIISRAKKTISIVFPLMVSVFRRADELALAMEAKGYPGVENRTSFRELKFKKLDYIIMTIIFSYTLLGILLK